MQTTNTISKILGVPSGRKDQYRMRIAVVAGLFLACLLFAYRAAKAKDPGEILSDPLLLLIPVAILILMFLLRPQLGLVSLIVASVSIPLEIRGGADARINSGMLLLALLLGLWVFKIIVEGEKTPLARSRTVLPLLVFVMFSIVSFAVGQLPWFSFAQKASLAAQLGGLAIFLLAAGAYLLVGNQLREVRWLKRLVGIFLVIAAVHVVGQIIPGMARLTSRLIQEHAHANSVFWIWLLALAFSQAAFNERLKSGLRLALFALVAGALVVSLGYGRSWTSGWLPPLVAVAVILWVSRSRLAWLSILIGVMMIVLKADSFERLIFSGDNTYSLMTRLEAWRIILEMVRSSPWFGLGPSNYYWYTPLYSILGYTVEFNSHNNYIDLIAQVGVLGLLAFLWFAWELWRVGWRLRDQVPAGFQRAYVYGALGGLAGMLVSGMLGDWILPFVYNIGFRGFRGSLVGWIFLGGLLALEVHQRNHVNHTPEVSDL